MLIAGCLIGWKAERVHRQRKIVRQIESLGGSVRYDYQTMGKISPVPASRWRAWSDKYLGQDFFAQVQGVSLSGCKVADVSFLRELPALESVNISGTQVSDLSPLKNSAEPHHAEGPQRTGAATSRRWPA